MGLSTKEVVVPDRQQTTQQWNVVFQWGLGEVVVDSFSTLQESLKVVIANVQGNRQTNSRPDRVTTTDPTFETKHVFGVNTELGNFGFVSGQSSKMLSNVRWIITCLRQEPVLSSVSVSDSFSGSESLGSNQKQSSFWVNNLQGFSNVSTVNVGNEVDIQDTSVVLQSLSDHDWT
ncbi:hypothetical protein AWRI1631_22720 [Saccharomyces cerevisiae AWRI1631]|uniref:Uncharacterized protein n=1 Tax=Saccharomyces cerevisiae (strain AWRI1631) TaxID=545124 RepID=B5VEE6_YEAS6|nr:hypothetical protein AWRI1631_22720 [Saccharomyces cerevisiae AWRI1631]